MHPALPFPPPARVKPKLRGTSHFVGFLVALAVGGWLVGEAETLRAQVAALIYVASLAGMYGASALYHVPMWSVRARRVLRRIDHSGIFLLIAGTYTPLCLLALPAPAGTRLLAVVWVGAALGIFKAIAWTKPPRALTAGLYVLLGWVAVFSLSDLSAVIGARGLWLIIGGGVVYSLGAGVYALKRPDPLPRVFGYHEVFHALVIAASVMHFTVVSRVVLGA